MSMFKRLLMSALIVAVVSSTLLQGMEHETEQNAALNNKIIPIETALQKSFQLLARLDAQPLFSGTGATGIGVDKCRVLPLAKSDSDYAFIIQRLCASAREKLGKNRAWVVENIHWSTSQVKDAQGKWIECGLTEWVYEDRVRTRCTVEELQLLFTEIISGLTTGWKQTSLAEYPDILHTKSGEEYYLFIKPKIGDYDDNLIRLFAAVTGVITVLLCHDDWNEPNSAPPISTPLLYLWIDKKEFETVVKALNLKVTLTKPSIA